VSDEDREINYKIKATDESGKGFSSAKREAEGFFGWLKQQQREKTASGERAFERMLSRGGAGVADTLADAVGVGVPAMITQIVGEKLRDFTGKMVEMRDQLAEGKMDGMQGFHQVMGDVPIIGPAWGAGQNIHELLTGEKAGLKAVNDEAQKPTIITRPAILSCSRCTRAFAR
jgi:hypothetical protein